MLEKIVTKMIKQPIDKNSPIIRKKVGFLSSWVGIGCNIVLFISKLIIGTVVGSIAIIADAFNNCSDMASSGITLAGFKLSSMPADKKHPFGHGRVEYISGIITSFLIIFVGLEFTKTSITRIFHPTEVTFSIVAVIILVISIVVKTFMGIFNYKLSKMIKSTAIKATAFDSISDVITTSVVLISFIISKFSDLPIDGYIGLAVGIFVAYNGVKLSIDTLSPLLGEKPDPDLVISIKKMLLGYPKINGIHDLMIHNYGPGRLFASVHAEVSVDEDIIEIHEIIDTAEEQIGRELNIHLVIHMDPLTTDDERINSLKDLAAKACLQIDKSLTIHDFRVLDGKGRVNLIFDVVVPYNFYLTKEQLTTKIQDILGKDDPRLRVVLTLDNSYA